MNNKLSVIIVAFNESSNIVDCIESALFADEVIVLDSGSTDNTVMLAQSAGARLIKTDWPGYGPQQNRGIDAATGDWIFSLDADERISSVLAEEIVRAIQEHKYEVFEVPRISLFVSRFMKHSGWRPDRTKRLFKREAARFTEHEIHAHLETKAAVGRLQQDIVHYSYHDFHSVLEKINRYSSGGARDYLAAGKQGSLSKAVGHGLWAFFRTYFIRAGFLDGREGFMLAIANAEVTYYRYIKLYYLQAKKTINPHHDE